MAELNKLYQTDCFQMAILYGRRRIGKSTLIKEFFKDKSAIYYVATKVGAQRNLELFSNEVTKILAPNLANIRFSTLEDLLMFIGDQNPTEKLLIAIDELPYWAESDESILSVWQKVIDQSWAEKNIFLILCGSSLSFMEDKVLSEKSPLFGRRTTQIKLKAFDYLESAEFVPDYTNEEKAICYGVTGGVAKYLSLIDPEKSLDENIVSLFFNKAGYLYDETRNLLVREFSNTVIVNNLIEQIASGENTVNLLADKIHEKEPTVLYYLNKLMSVGLIEKKKCITEESNKKKVQYVLSDQMFRFWYAFIPNANSAIELDKGDVYYEKIVKPRLHSFMGSVFEEICRYYTLKAGIAGELNCFVTQVGNWWGTQLISEGSGSNKVQSVDVDIVGLAPHEKSMVVAECKFKNEKVGKSVLDTLQLRAKLIPSKYEVSQYLLFSLGGYSSWYDNVDNTMVRLLTLDDLYS